MFSGWFLKAAIGLLSIVGSVAAIFYQGKRSERLGNVEKKLKEKEEVLKIKKETERVERKMRKTPGSKSLSAALDRLRKPKDRS